MIKKLRLINFKSFKDVELDVGQLTLLLGTNASGKSNLRDAFRFLHGIGRGYAIADIIGGKYGEGGERVWGGIRGGPREIVFGEENTFTLEVDLNIDIAEEARLARYHIEINPGNNNFPGRVVSEWLKFTDESLNSYVFLSDESEMNSNFLSTLIRKPQEKDEQIKTLKLIPEKFDSIKLADYTENPIAMRVVLFAYKQEDHVNTRSILSQILETRDDEIVYPLIQNIIRSVLSTLASMRFLDLNPDSMRQSSFPGQNTLSDQGANLSSVLLDICSNPQRKDILVNWLQALTPMDTADFEFTSDQIGRVLVTLVERNGRKTSAYSASDGTLRFLAMLAALLGPETARCYFFEELDNGIHPTRLNLLLQLIEQHVAQGTTQVISTTHSPQLLRLVSPNTLESTSIIYRLPEHAYSQIKRLYDIPDIQRVLEQDDPARLLESGWFEDAIAFTSDESDT